MIDWVLKPALLLALAGAVHLLARRAATRHFAWALAFAGLAALPFAPSFSLVETVVPVTAPAIVQTVDQSLAPPAAPAPAIALPRGATNDPSKRIRNLVFLLWCAGVVAALARLVPGFWKVRRLTSEGTPAGRHRRAMILEHPEVATPFTWGVLRPVIILPVAGAEWSSERRQNVLAHEYAHIDRADWLTQSLAQAVCAIYWFHPLVWMAALWMRRASEQACDDAVVRDGSSPEGYAEHLLDLAKSDDRELAPPPPVAVAMWNRSQLEERIMRILEQHDRRGLGKIAAAGMTLLAIAAIAPIASVRVQAQTKSTVVLRGVVSDPSGARVPEAKVIAKVLSKDPKISSSVVALTGGDGAFRMEVPVSPLMMVVEKPGFAAVSRSMTVDGSQAEVIRDFSLSVGQISETVSVPGERTGPKPTVQAKPVRIRVGGNIAAARLIHKTNPEYPKDLQAQNVEGTVELEAVVSKEGNVLNLHPRSKLVHEGLIQAAIDAVKTWQYSPTLLNGEPVEVVTTVSVRFYLQ